MAWKQTGQLSIADNLINWQTIEQTLRHVHSSDSGNSAFQPVIIFKVLLLQKLYNLSDPAMEKQLPRDLLFRRFVGLSLTDDVPDHSTIWRYHKHLGEVGLIEPLFNQINEQLTQLNILIKAGSVGIIDASIIKAKNKRLKKGKHTDNTQDNEASYASKKDSSGKVKTTCGFKINLNCDEDSFVKNFKTTTANIHDSESFTDLLIGHESAVYAASAYKSQAHWLFSPRWTTNKQSYLWWA